ncbi:MAG: shikimate kinase [Propionicimonas sp.]
MVGAPAAGKTTVGRLVAERLGVPFTDTDELLADRLGLSLPEAWANLPEPEILEAEAEICRSAVQRPGVMALGSRAVADPELRAELRPLERRLATGFVHATDPATGYGQPGHGDAGSPPTANGRPARPSANPGMKRSRHSQLDTDRLDVGGGGRPG